MPLKRYYVSSFQLQTHEVVEICAKILYQVELCRDNLDIMWGFSVEAELVENSDRQDELCCYVSRVEERSVAIHNGKYAAALTIPGLIFVRTILVQNGKWSPFLELTPTL